MHLKIKADNQWHAVLKEGFVMRKRKIELIQAGEEFGKRLAQLRQAAGYFQRELAAELRISQRIVAYYEKETEYPPAHLLPLLAKALKSISRSIIRLGKRKAKRQGPR